jgi:outer membrane protein TolC
MKSVLREIEKNNKTIQAQTSYSEAMKIENKMDSNLPDPSVSYSHQYGNRDDLGVQGELIASQSFDFPTVYYQKRKLRQKLSDGIDISQETVRRDVLLQAKELLIDLVSINKQNSLLSTRLENAEKLSRLYAVKLERGDANVLEKNKIDLELLNARNEYRVNQSVKESKLKELAALNGGEFINFDCEEYDASDVLSSNKEELKQTYLDANLELQAANNEKLSEQRRVGVAKNLNLPGLELGYRLNTAKGGERFNGFLVGMSVPLFANRGNVRMTKARALAKELAADNTNTEQSAQFDQLYAQASALSSSIVEYTSVLKEQKTLDLLNKAIEAGQISMIEYFVDAATYYQTLENYNQLQCEYQKLLARIYKFAL